MELKDRIAQRDAALARANEVRRKRGTIRRQVANLPRRKGCARLAEYVADPPPELQTVHITELIGWLWGVGRLRSRRFLRTASISRYEAELVDLTPQERRRLVLALRDGV